MHHSLCADRILSSAQRVFLTFSLPNDKNSNKSEQSWRLTKSEKRNPTPSRRLILRVRTVIITVSCEYVIYCQSFLTLNAPTCGHARTTTLLHRFLVSRTLALSLSFSLFRVYRFIIVAASHTFRHLDIYNHQCPVAETHFASASPEVEVECVDVKETMFLHSSLSLCLVSLIPFSS